MLKQNLSPRLEQQLNGSDGRDAAQLVLLDTMLTDTFIAAQQLDTGRCL
jgi:hypothetical protein